MIRRFVIATDALTAAQEKQLSEALGKTGWWHWLPNFWLVRDSSGSLTVGAITSIIKNIDKTKRAMVLEVNPVTWSALSRKNAAGRDMTAWIKETWNEPK